MEEGRLKVDAVLKNSKYCLDRKSLQPTWDVRCLVTNYATRMRDTKYMLGQKSTELEISLSEIKCEYRRQLANVCRVLVGSKLRLPYLKMCRPLPQGGRAAAQRADADPRP